MKKGAKHKTKTAEEPQTAYLTTRALERALSKATRNLTEEAMELMGYIVITEDGWVVKKFKDGSVEKIEKIKKVKLSKNIDLG